MNQEKNIDVSRYVNSVTWDFMIEIITPAFMHGADSRYIQLRSASFKDNCVKRYKEARYIQLRSASFKGLLRYWWRVLYGAKYGDNIRQREFEIFGSATDEKKIRAGKSNVQIQISANPKKPIIGYVPFPQKGKTVINSKPQINPLDYLTYGIKPKIALLPGTRFNLKLTVKKEYSEEVLQAFLFLCQYGGIGAKNRNGFGSLKIITSFPVASTSGNKIYTAPQEQGYSALSRSSLLFSTKKLFNTWEEALLELADIYIDARRSLDTLHHFENRGLLARPIISKKDKIDPFICRGRHPKFLIMSVTQSETGKYYGTILTLPIRFSEIEKNKYNKEQSDHNYSNMVKEIHQLLSQRMTNNTKTLIGESK
ncbi:MAG: type III-B CRISPR module RAMP protein Cmr1 [Spirochaetia bacterium]|nr:type III-B CRISPR module RAMP protein Cmr1 [Spirochaetia bacterium]